MQVRKIVQRGILLKIKIKKKKVFYVVWFVHRTLCYNTMIRKLSRRVSICICGHSVKKPKANQRNKPKPEELIWSSIKNMLKYIVCTQHKLWMLLPQYSSIPSPLYIPRALSTGSFGEKKSFSGQEKPIYLHSCKTEQCRKGSEKTIQKSQNKDTTISIFSFYWASVWVSCQPLELFSVREQEIKAQDLNVWCAVLLCSSCRNQHRSAVTKIISVERSELWAHQAWVGSGLPVWGSHQQVLARRGKRQERLGQTERDHCLSAGRKQGQNLVWIKQKLNALSFSKL